MAFTFQRDIILWTLQQQKRQRQRQTALKYCFEFSHNSRLSFGLSCCLQIDQTLLLFFAGLQWSEFSALKDPKKYALQLMGILFSEDEIISGMVGPLNPKSKKEELQ